MTVPPDDERDARVNRVLARATAPVDDPAFRARVIARIERDRAAWGLPGLLRIAGPVLTVLCVGLVLWYSDARLRDRAARDERQAPLATSPVAAPATGSSTLLAPHGPAPDTIRAGQPEDARRGAAAGPAGTQRGDAGSSARLSKPRPAASGTGTSVLRLARAEPPDRDLTPAIPRVIVAQIDLGAIDIEPLPAAATLAGPGSPALVEIVPVLVEPIEGHR
jgi:hypothetical protein